MIKKIEYCILQAIKAGKTTFCIGMARGTDMLAGEIIVKLREKKNEIKLVGIIPYEKQSSEWNIQDKQRYNDLIKQCDIIFESVY